MSDAYLSEIRLFGFNFPPKGWAQCNGQFMPINQNQALFALLGTMYGGNGQTTFALPDLRGRAPMHVGDSFSTQGEAAGQEVHTLTQSEMPAHNHFAQASSLDGTVIIAVGNMLARTTAQLYNDAANFTAMNAATISNVGGSQAHPNMQPYLTLNFCICLVGIFPSRN